MQALSSYRTWTTKAGRTRDAPLEAELLFRCASSCYQGGRYSRAVELLDEANEKDPVGQGRLLSYKAVALAKAGDYAESAGIFADLQDEFHSAVLLFLSEQGRGLPGQEPQDLAFEKTMLLRFWKNMISCGEADSSSIVLRNIGRAYKIYCSGDDPEPCLRRLKDRPGMESLICYLLLLLSVQKRSRTKVRNLIQNNHTAYRNRTSEALLRTHLLLLLGERQYEEISNLDALLEECQIMPQGVQDIRDELHFNLGLKEIEEKQLEKALDHFLKIQKKTPHVMHNTALLYQKLGQHVEANEHWRRLLHQEKKPKRSDPEAAKISYAVSLKYIARNYVDMGEHQEAFTYLREALTLSGQNKDILEPLYKTATDLDKKQEALGYAKKLYEQEPRNEEYLYYYINALDALDRVDTLIDLYQAALERDPKNEFYLRGLASSYVKAAWAARKTSLEQSRNFTEKARETAGEPGKLLYLEGYFLKADGKFKSAERKFRKAMQTAKGHLEQYELAVAYYEDGMAQHALQLFIAIAACDCDDSLIVFKMVVVFLAAQDDRDNAIKLCNLALDNKDYHLYFLSEKLLDCGKPSWALGFSRRLIKSRSADDDDCYQHLRILNAIGRREDTLRYAAKLYEDAIGRGDAEDTDLYKYLMKQIKTRGRFKDP